ncbi:MAG: aldo/keto reductase [Methylobacterium sp.]|nr:aldo/keto reductase [Methylobacterium sp.]
MENVRLGQNGSLVSAFGLGCMGMSDFYGPADRGESIATIHAALDSGITMLDTGDFYGVGHNEMLIAEALKGRRRENVFIAVKFGAMRDPAGGFIGLDLRPQSVKNFLAYTLQRLGTDYVDLYMPARLTPEVPIEETIGTMAEMVKAGHVRHIGLSEAGAGSLRRAHAVHPIAALQIEYSLISRGIEEDILPTAKELGVAITAYGVLSRGLISGHWSQARQEATRDFRAILPRFQGENFAANLKLVEELKIIAAEKGATPAQIAIAWVKAQGLAMGATIVPLIGARTRRRLTESLGAAGITLGIDDLARIEQAIPPDAAKGSRYPDYQMAMLDSERR